MIIFEQQFRYPLGDGSTFRIHHPTPYTRFAQSIGHGACFIATDNDRIIGVISVSIRDICIAGVVQQCAYIFDLKLAPDNKNPFTLLRLLQRAQAWAETFCNSAYAVVMDGTNKTPDQYTGRLAIPQFHKIQSLYVLLFPCAAAAINLEPQTLQMHASAQDQIDTIHSRFEQRSLLSPSTLSIDQENWAVLEDTRQAKQLFDQENHEIKAAHLSYLHFTNPTDANTLIDTARHLAAQQDYAQLFCCLNQTQYERMNTELRAQASLSTASLYTYNIDANQAWLIHSSEI